MREMKMDEKTMRATRQATLENLTACLDDMLRGLEDRSNIIEAAGLVMNVVQSFYVSSYGATCQTLLERGVPHEAIALEITQIHAVALELIMDSIKESNLDSAAF